MMGPSALEELLTPAAYPTFKLLCSHTDLLFYSALCPPYLPRTTNLVLSTALLRAWDILAFLTHPLHPTWPLSCLSSVLTTPPQVIVRPLSSGCLWLLLSVLTLWAHNLNVYLLHLCLLGRV